MESETGRKRTSGRHRQDEEKAQNSRSGCMLLMTVSLGFICLLLLITIILQHFMIQSERAAMQRNRNTELQQFCLPGHYSHSQMTHSNPGYPCRLDGFIVSMEVKNWSESRQFCRKYGADLVIIKSIEKQKHIFSLVKRMNVPVWIGLSDREKEGTMKWVDNSTLSGGFWMTGEPNNAHGKEDCVEMNPKPDLKDWNDVICSEMSHFICE